MTRYEMYNRVMKKKYIEDELVILRFVEIFKEIAEYIEKHRFEGDDGVDYIEVIPLKNTIREAINKK